ncbi:hypothetical protein, partial [Parvibaculum sp.]|uniref:hypothetical protein n=1 Tax=Parvibaculum sp. TaxID=2024848 RepID=UPI0034A07FD7
MTLQTSRRTRTGQKARLAAALLASAAVSALTAGTAKAAPNQCPEGYVAIEAGGRAATGDLTLSGNYGGAPESGGGTFAHGVVGFDVGIHIRESMGGTTNVQAPPAELTDDIGLPPDQLLQEPEANKRRKAELERNIKKLMEERDVLEKERGYDNPEVRDLSRRINVARKQINELDESWSEIMLQEAHERRTRTRRAAVPCDGPVIGVRGRLPVGGKETSHHNIHPAPSTPTSVSYDASWMLTPFIGWLFLLDCELTPGGNVAVTPWAGVTFERGKLGMTTDELGTVSSFSENVNRSGPSIGVNVDVPLGERTFMGLGLQGDWLSSVSASGTSPSF